MKNLEFLLGAYFVFWLGTFAYVYTLQKRQKEISEKLDKHLSNQKNV